MDKNHKLFDDQYPLVHMAFKLPIPSSALWLLHGSSARKWNILAKKIADHPLNHAVRFSSHYLASMS